eukprot:g22621.t1
MSPGLSCVGETCNTTNWSCHPSLSEYRYFGASLGVLVTAVGGVGNLLTILAFASEPRLRTRFNLLILNLTVSDLLYCGFLQPLNVETYLRARWSQGRTGCRVFGLLVFTSNLVSILNLTLIAAARYALVSSPRCFQRVSGRWWAIPLFLGAPWLVSLALLVPFWGVFDFLPSVCSCSIHPGRVRLATTVLHILTFGLGLASIGVFYLLIYRKVKSTGRAARSYGVPGPAEASSSQRETGSRSRVSEDAELEREEEEGDSGSVATGSGRRVKGRTMSKWSRRRTTRRGPRESEASRVTTMCFAVFLVYLACYLPFCLANLFHRALPHVVRTLAGNITWLNSCANPVLYAIMNRQFRDAYRGVLRLPCSL